MLSEAILWIATTQCGVPHLLFLLDDFLAIKNRLSDYEATKQRLLSLFKELRVPLNDKETVGLATTLKYLGIILH